MVERDIKEVARFIIETGTTVRQAAEVFTVSKSSIHKDVTERLEKIDSQLYKEVRKVLDKNKEERAIRGGMATRERYLKLKES